MDSSIPAPRRLRGAVPGRLGGPELRRLGGSASEGWVFSVLRLFLNKYDLDKFRNYKTLPIW